MRVICRNGVSLAWEDQGSGIPILLIMGHRYSSRMWYPVSEDLHGLYRLISFDNRGSGQSGYRPTTTISEMVGDAIAVLDAAGVESAHIYGVSMGGSIAIELAIQHPTRVRSLILGCTMAKTSASTSPPRWLLKTVYGLPVRLLRLAAPKRHNQGYGDAASPDAIARDIRARADEPFNKPGILAQALAFRDYSVDIKYLRTTEIPTLVLHGTQDQVVPYRMGKELSDLIPHARMVTLQDCGHNYFVGGRQVSNNAVHHFIEEAERSRQGSRISSRSHSGTA